MFYPAEAATLERTVAELLAAAPAGEDDAKAIIAPHAGYQFSGPTAARAYRLFEGRRERIRRVVLLGPAHRVYLHGMALPSVDAFTTPLGDVPIDADGVRQALAMPGTQISDEAHAAEHSLEVHLPFLQTVLDDFSLVPIVKTTARIEARETTLRGEEACGAYAVNGLLLAARAHGLQVRTLDVRNSGDTAGDKLRVVGYGAYALG
jgi:AmmeMemoRadiSam system protein B